METSLPDPFRHDKLDSSLGCFFVQLDNLNHALQRYPGGNFAWQSRLCDDLENALKALLITETELHREHGSFYHTDGHGLAVEKLPVIGSRFQRMPNRVPEGEH